MPNQPKTKGRMFRIPDDVYEAAQARASAEKVPVTAVVVHALRRYAEGATVNVTPRPDGR